jgi:hypothetical protein
LKHRNPLARLNRLLHAMATRPENRTQSRRRLSQPGSRDVKRGNDDGGAVVAMAMRGNPRVRRHANFNRIRPGHIGIA